MCIEISDDIVEFIVLQYSKNDHYVLQNIVESEDQMFSGQKWDFHDYSGLSGLSSPRRNLKNVEGNQTVPK